MRGRRRAISVCGLAALIGCSAEAGPTGPTGAQGPEGPTGPPGPGTTPSISAVAPLKIYWDHQDTVVLSGSGTSWDASTVVDFGAGVSVQSVTVASPTAIVAHVLADNSAATGPRPIIVRAAADTTRFEDAFHVEAPLGITYAGSWVPGGELDVSALQRNVRRPFQLPGSTSFATVNFPELGLQASGGRPDERHFDFTVRIPLNAPPGPLSMSVVSEADSTVSRSEPIDLPQLTTVVTPLGAAVQGTITAPYGTVVHEYQTQPGMAVGFTVSSPSGVVEASPVAPDSTSLAGGGWTFYAQQSSTWFVPLREGGGAASLDYTFTVDTMTVTPVQLSATPVTGTLSGLNSYDFYSFDLAVGEVLTVTVSDGPTDSCGAGIDAVVTVREPTDRAVWVEVGGCPTFSTFAAEFAGTYSVEVVALPECECSFDYTIAAVIE